MIFQFLFLFGPSFARSARTALVCAQKASKAGELGDDSRLLRGGFHAIGSGGEYGRLFRQHRGIGSLVGLKILPFSLDVSSGSGQPTECRVRATIYSLSRTFAARVEPLLKNC